MTLHDIMSRPPIFEPSPGSITGVGEGNEHGYLRAEPITGVAAPHSAGNELYEMISHLSNLSREKYQHNGCTSVKLLALAQMMLKGTWMLRL